MAGRLTTFPEIRKYAVDSVPPDYATAFDAWLEETITEGREEVLLDYEKQGPSASRNHPYPAEHFLPLFVPLGAAGSGAKGRVLHKAFMYGSCPWQPMPGIDVSRSTQAKEVRRKSHSLRP